MKNFLFILTLLFGMLLFAPTDKVENSNLQDLDNQQEVVMKEKSTNDMQHNLEVLSSELKSSNFLTPRRTVQSSSNTVNIRLLKIEEKAFQFFHLKELNLLRKVSEDVITYQSIKVSTLLSRMGYHVFALRKIII